MSCETYRERLALDLYSELEADEARRLEAHLESCAGCRVLRDELAAGLGRLRPDLGDVEWPADWNERLRVSIDEVPRGRRTLHRTWWPLAAGLAAGLFLGWLTAPAGTGERRSDPGGEVAGFRRAEPPPLAVTLGRSGTLEAWLRR